VASVTSYVTRLRLTRTAEAARQDITARDGMEMWRVDWTLQTNGRDQQLTMSHCTAKAARRHVDGLLTRRPPALSADDVYTEVIG
jgi:hypothetical protein